MLAVVLFRRSLLLLIALVKFGKSICRIAVTIRTVNALENCFAEIPHTPRQAGKAQQRYHEPERAPHALDPRTLRAEAIDATVQTRRANERTAIGQDAS